MADNTDIAAILAYLEDNREPHRAWEPRRPPAFYTREFWMAQIGRSHADFAGGRAVRVFIFDVNTEGEVIGSVNFTEVVRGSFHACYLGYGLSARRWGQGLMTEALREAIRWMFEEFYMHRIMANYMPHNERSAAVLRRLGFVEEGRARAYLLIDGEWRDHVLTALTNPKWTPPPF
jgi:ribosomal-protein-alanine N-acetyltransferase